MIIIGATHVGNTNGNMMMGKNIGRTIGNNGRTMEKTWGTKLANGTMKNNIRNNIGNNIGRVPTMEYNRGNDIGTNSYHGEQHWDE